MGNDATKLRQHNRDLSILNAIAQTLNQSVDINQTLHSVLAQVAELLDLQTGWVWLLHEDDAFASYLAAAQKLILNPRFKKNGFFFTFNHCYRSILFISDCCSVSTQSTVALTS
ncbi:MAG: hypothetical protein GY943_16165 [Chloroflexi bacterium]|nr:hypothetical protein [Chloroflexota bacterium]